MTFGESSKNNKEKVKSIPVKPIDPKYSMPRWCPLGLKHSQKRKLQHLRAKKEGRRRWKRYSMIHTLNIHHQKRCRPKAVEIKETVT
jgi:hypothetical protein